jgi:hypothetical protein
LALERLPEEISGSKCPAPHRAHLAGVLSKSISTSDAGQTFLSAGSGDFPVHGFRFKLSALIREFLLKKACFSFLARIDHLTDKK